MKNQQISLPVAREISAQWATRTRCEEKKNGSKKTVLDVLSIASQITKSVAAVANLVEESSTGTFTKNGESGFVKHDYPEAAAEVLMGPDPVPVDVPGEKSFTSVRELAIPGQTTMRTVPSGVIPFVLVEYVSGRWNVASIDTWISVVNEIEARVLRYKKLLRSVLKSAGKWRGCGSIYLRDDDLQLLEQWRDMVPVLSSTLNTFPRDALLLSDELTIMMMDDLKTYKLDCLMDSLFTRNNTLRGHARVTCSKVFGNRDFTSTFQSKDGWRLCYVEGDAVFLQSLAQHTASHRFEVGCGLVTIRGGIRKPCFLNRIFNGMPWNPRKWTRPSEYKLLQSLRPLPRDDSTLPASVDVGVSQVVKEGMDRVSPVRVGITRTSSAPSKMPGSTLNRPRTRSERLKIQREKKAAFKKKKSALKLSGSTT